MFGQDSLAPSKPTNQAVAEISFALIAKIAAAVDAALRAGFQTSAEAVVEAYFEMVRRSLAAGA